MEPGIPRNSVMLPVAARLQADASDAGVGLELITGPADHPRLAIRVLQSTRAPDHAEAYALDISPKSVRLHYRDFADLRTGVATMSQLLREHGRRLPCLSIRDYPDFPRRGV